MRRRLGSGGFATVWLAYDEQLDAEVAVKVLADNWGHDDSVRRRFLEEGRFLRRVESEHVVQVHDVGELEDGRPFLVLTYADRGTLADRLRDAPLLLEPAVGVIVQVGRGLQALHRRGLLHRDVKPANVLFRSTDDGERAVLSDLGLGKSLDEVSRITMPGGTPSYVAPEQAMGERLDQRADQYSLGAVAYAALTGRSPHQVDGLGAAGRVHAPAPPSSLGFDIPDRIDAAIVRALDPDREQRWPDVATFTRELVGALDETTHSFIATPLKPSPKPAAAGAGAAGPESPTEVVDPAGEKTAFSDSNAPTVVKTSDAGDPPMAAFTGSLPTAPAADQAGAAAGAASADAKAPAEGASAAAAGGASAAAAGAKDTGAATTGSAAGPKDAGAEGVGKKRRRGRWVVAALLAVVVGGGAGFGVQRYLEPRLMVDVHREPFSLKVPGAVAGVVAASSWRPPGSTKDWPAVRVSKDNNWNSADLHTPGVFVGAMAYPNDPAKSLAAGGQYGCTADAGIAESTSSDGRRTADRYLSDCAEGSSLLQRIIETGDGGALLIQVRLEGNDPGRAAEVANSVEYSGGGAP